MDYIFLALNKQTTNLTLASFLKIVYNFNTDYVGTFYWLRPDNYKVEIAPKFKLNEISEI